LYLAAAYLLAMPFFLVVVDYPSVVDPVEKVRLLVDHHASVHVMYLVTYVLFGIALAVLALALHQRLRAAAPALMDVATVVGLLWATVLVASGMIFNGGMAAVVDRYPTEPAEAVTMWQSIEPVAMALGGSGGEILGGTWVLLVTIAGRRALALPKRLGWLGMAIGVAGIASAITPLHDAGIAFGLLQIVWFGWLGVTLLRSTQRSGLVAVHRSPSTLSDPPATIATVSTT
jgi:hypothetical protein